MQASCAMFNIQMHLLPCSLLKLENWSQDLTHHSGIGYTGSQHESESESGTESDSSSGQRDPKKSKTSKGPCLNSQVSCSTS